MTDKIIRTENGYFFDTDCGEYYPLNLCTCDKSNGLLTCKECGKQTYLGFLRERYEDQVEYSMAVQVKLLENMSKLLEIIK